MKHISLLTHFAAAVLFTAIILLVYAAVQQAHRSTADDPQLQLARDIKNALENGKPVNNLMPKDTIDISKSLATFAEIFDKQGNQVESTGLLNGNLPKPPAGVLNFTKDNTEKALTWQPQEDVRMAMVYEKVNAGNAGFVGVGRSLQEVEVREANLLRMCEIVWFICVVLIIVHYALQHFIIKRNTK